MLLAAAVPARPGQAVLDLGVGAGAALFCLAARVPGLRLVGVERQPCYAALARRNAAENGFAARIFQGDVAAPPPALRAAAFDHVISNPPYDPAGGTAPAEIGRAAAHQESLPLDVFLDHGLRRLRPGGCLTVIQRADRLPTLLAALDGRAGDATLLPIAGRAGHAAKRILVQVRKARRGPLRLLPPLVMHSGPAHRSDAPDFTPQARAILRDAAALPLAPPISAGDKGA